MGWGTPQQITTPNWQTMSVNDATQTVQGSGFPNAYARQEGHEAGVAFLKISNTAR